MYTITMHSWTLNSKRNIIGNYPIVLQIKADTISKAMVLIKDAKENHDISRSTPYEIVNIFNDEE